MWYNSNILRIGGININPILYIVIPCCNESEVLPITAPMFLKCLENMAENELIDKKSRILFIDDGSTDKTWEIIEDLSRSDDRYCGIKQSKNRGHQSSLLAGLMYAKDLCDITISIDCDGQDDISVMPEMVKKYRAGSDIVYGVRKSRDTDSGFKRTSARAFYKFMGAMGAKVVYDHADYRLISSKVLSYLSEFKEVNLFLRGMIPLVGFNSTCVYYDRAKRIAGESHYPLKKMLALALDGITSLSTKPLKLIISLGIIVSLLSFIGVIYAFVSYITGAAVTGWASIVCIICFMGGIQLISLGIIGEYVGKTYLEVKHRPRYIISDKTDNLKK